MLRPNDYVYMLNDSRARALFIHAALWSQIEPILAELKYLRHIIVVGTLPTASRADASTPAIHDFEQWVNKASSSLKTAETSKDDSAFWLYSSGSTGTPKGAVHLQHDIICTIEGYARGVLDMAEHDR